MRDMDSLRWNGFYPPEEPRDPIGDVILDDGPGGPGKRTKERMRKRRGYRNPWEQNPEPDYLEQLEEEIYIMDKNTIREVGTENLELVAKGAQGAVYRYGSDKVLKLYHAGITYEDILLMRAREDFLNEAGISAVNVYEAVRCGDQYGMVCEYINGEMFGKHIMSHPEQFEECADEYVRLIRRINGTPAPDGLFDNKKESCYLKRFEELKGKLTELELDKLRRFVEAIPERNTLIHGDAHPRNFMICNGKLVIVDIDSFSYGHPILELSRIYCMLVSASGSVGDVSRFVGVDAETGGRLWKHFLANYFPGAGQGELEQIERYVAAYAFLEGLFLILSFRDEEKESKFIEKMRSVFLPCIEELTGREPWDPALTGEEDK